MLAYHFPPVGGAGVQRAVKFARYLGEFGYDAVVLTGNGQAEGRWTPRDETLLEELPPGLDVLRLAAPEPPRSTGFRATRERWLGTRTRFARWWTSGLTAAARQLPPVDLILTTMSPFESAEVAAEIAARLHVPWVADLRDPWALDEMRVYPTALHRKLEESRMRSALASADAIVMNTREAAQRLAERFPEFHGRFVTSIPNGFDSADFSSHVTPRVDAAFRIVHAGYLHTDLGREDRFVRRLLGGSTQKASRKARSLLYLSEAIFRLRRREPELAGALEIHVAGVLSESDRSMLPADLLHAHGYLPHRGAIELMRSADLLFLPMHDLAPGRRATIVPGKTYEYLATGRPLLAALPDGDARDVVAQVPGAFLCRPTDIAGMERILEKLLRKRTTAEPPSGPSEGFLAQFERRHLAGRLADVFDRVLAEPQGPTVPS